MRAYSAVRILCVDYWKAFCALLFVRPKKILKLVVHRLDSQAQSDSAVRPFAREALYLDGLSRSSYHRVIVIIRPLLIIFSGHDELLSLASTLGRHTTPSAGGNLK